MDDFEFVEEFSGAGSDCRDINYSELEILFSSSSVVDSS